MAVEALRSEFLCSLTGFVAPPRDGVRRLAAPDVSIRQSADLSKGLACVGRCFPMAVIGCCCGQMAYWNRTCGLR